MKKIKFVVITALMLVMSLCCFGAEVELELSGGYVGEGDYVKIPISIDSLDTEIDMVVVENFSYDKDTFSFVGCEKSISSVVADFSENEFNADDRIIDVAFDDSGIKNGYLCNLVFLVKEDAAFGNYNFGAEGYAMSGTKKYDANVTSANIFLTDMEKGDINIDGNVDINDAILLFQHSMMPYSYPISYRGLIDFEKSGYIDINDAILLFQYSMMSTVYELNDEWIGGIEAGEEVEEEVVPVEKTEPYFLIDDYLMNAAAGGVARIGSGWTVDYTGGSKTTFGGWDAYINTLEDKKTDDNMRIYRDVFPQEEGVLTFETSFGITSGNTYGVSVNFYDDEQNVIFSMGTVNKVNGKSAEGLYFTDGDDRVEVAASHDSLRADTNGYYSNTIYSTYKVRYQIRPRLVFDLDKRTVKVQISGKDFGTYKLSDTAGAFARVEFATGISEKQTLLVNQVHLYKNYDVYDVFRTDKKTEEPYGYKTRGDVSVQYNEGICDNQGDYYSVRMNVDDGTPAYARRTFDAIAGKARYEIHLRTENGVDGAYFYIGRKNNPAIKVVTQDNMFYLENEDGTLGQELRKFTTNVWQRITIDADAELQTATIKINGKIVAEDVPFVCETDCINFLEFGSAAEDTDIVWFDDVKVMRLFEYDDYVPEPEPLDTGDYILSMSVCNLWRNGSHYGWSHVQSHPEIEPITGFYDEGSSEAMDWEIKFLVEHGVKNYNMCWYSPNGNSTVPIRKSRMNDALHDGYFNSKYSDYLNFSIMWENSNSWGSSVDDFKNGIFKYWMDWYFSDDRYFRIKDENTGEEKLLLTIYRYERVLRLVCGSDSPTGTQKTQAEAAVTELIQWMSDQVKEAGYADGLIVIFNHSGWGTETDLTIKNMGATAIYPYAWGDTAWNVDTQKSIVNNFYEQSQAAGLDLLALAAVGFNDIGWAYERHQMMSDEGFEELLTWFRDDYMPRFENAEESWKQYFIQFDTWNEYGEGHYIYPTVGMEAIEGEYGYDGYGGYGYLEAMAKVFGTDYDEELHEEIDITPTEEQKERIGHIFYNSTQLIRREFLPQNTVDPEKPEVVLANCNFGSATDMGKSLQGTSGATAAYDSSESSMYLRTTNRDPIVHLSPDIVGGIDADEVEIIYIRMKSAIGATNGQIFYKTSEMTSNYNESDTIIFAFGEPNEWVEYYLDANSFPDSFAGTIEKMRFDIGDQPDNDVWISDVQFLKYSDAQKNNKVTITIDGAAYTPKDEGEIQGFNKSEVYIAPADNDFFYMRAHMSYEWYKKEGRLYIDTPNGTTFEFVEGSDEVVVDGYKTETLAQPFEVYDGVPVIPLLYILKRAEYTYLYNANTYTLDIYVNTGSFAEIENGNAENPDKADAFYSDNESTVSIVTDPENSNNFVWRVIGADDTNSMIKTNLDLWDDYEYTVEFDIYIDSLNGDNWWNDLSYELYFTAEYDDESGDTEHLLDETATVEFGSWQHVKYTFTTPEELVDSDVAETIGFHILPDAWDGYGVNFYLDNFMVKYS